MHMKQRVGDQFVFLNSRPRELQDPCIKPGRVWLGKGEGSSNSLQLSRVLTLTPVPNRGHT